MTSQADEAGARDRQIRRVLGGILVANLAVVVAKVVVAVSTGSLAVFGDAIHSSVDALNNVIGLIVVRLAARGPDDDHPYGHAKFETVGALAVVVFLSATILELLRGAVGRLVMGGQPPAVDATAAWLMGGTLLVNVWVVWYETRAGRRWRSDILLADAAHTRADVVITLTVIAGLLLSAAGLTWADPVLAILVAGAVIRIGYHIVRRSIPSLVDAAAVAQTTIGAAALQVEGVRAAYDIRSRTAAWRRFAELTIAVDGTVDVAAAHRIADAVEARLGSELGFHEIVVHVEPC
jgi:cation diffusion facilitator family transporter